MEINYRDGKMAVRSEYSKEFIKGAKRLNAKWDGSAWVFDERDKERVNQLLLEIYGENESVAGEEVDVQLDLDKLDDCGSELELFGRILARRPGRDLPVKLHSSVIILKGDFPRRGGSASYPNLKPEDGTILLVRDVPLSLYLKEKERLGETIFLDCGNSSESNEITELKAEKESLLKRLEEIEKRLAELA